MQALHIDAKTFLALLEDTESSCFGDFVQNSSTPQNSTAFLHDLVADVLRRPDSNDSII